MNKSIKNFFYPQSICIYGASSKPLSIGYELTKTIISYGYTGKLFLINPKAGELFGLKCHKNLLDITEKIDLAIVLVPKLFVADSINELLKSGVKSIVLITAGFKETGKEGELAEQSLLKEIKQFDARLVGPNCMGLINTLPDVKLNATFVAETPHKGSLGFLSQSGALGAAVLNSLRETKIKFAHFISIGNKADINENDLLDYWNEDENIKVITMYLESFSIGKEFVKKINSKKNNKPVVVLKAGKTASGIKAASSHTGALGSSDKVVDAVLKQYNVIRVEDIKELFNIAQYIENFPLPYGNRVAVVTNAGGPAILAVDKIDDCGLKLAEFDDELKTKLREIIHAEGSVNNPVDLLPGGTAEGYAKVINLLKNSDLVDAVISIFVEPVMVKPFPVIEGINNIESDKPILQVVLPLPEFWNNYDEQSKSQKPLYRSPEEPAVILSKVLAYNKNKILEKLDINFSEETYNSERLLTQDEISSLFGKYELNLPEKTILKHYDLKYSDLTYPVVLKAVNEKIIHKTEFEAVKLNIQNKEQLIKEADKMIAAVKNSGITLDTFLIQPFFKTKFELLLGGFYDNNFGPMIMFGSGGKYVEQVNDTSIKSAFINDENINDIINSTKIGKIIQGVRGEKSINIEDLKKIINNLAKLMSENQNISELDINPLIVSEDLKLHLVDVRVKIKENNENN